MNKFLLFLYIILLTGYSHSQQWNKVVSGSLPDLNSIYFTDEDTGFSVGLFGTIIKTTDGGNSWIEKQSGTKKHLNNIFYSNKNFGVIAGDDRTILYTLDNGETWRLDSLTVVPDPLADIKKIYFEDEKNGWTIVSTSKKSWVLRTNSGGEYWTIDTTIMAELHEITFYNGKGIITGKKVSDIYYSEDGVNWTNCNLPLNWNAGMYGERSDIRAVFMNENLVYATGWGSSGYPTIHLKSVDGGVTWEYLLQQPEKSTYDNLFGICFKDELNGIAVGGSNTKGALVTKTTDGGINWHKVILPLGGSLQSIFKSNDKLWICGTGGIIASSENFGDTWKLSTIPNGNLTSIEIPSSKVGYAGGQKGTLFKTTDGGTNWSISFLNNGSTVTQINDLQFFNENLGFSAQEDRSITKTTDGGTTWNALISDTSGKKSKSVFFLNEDLGFFVGFQSSKYDNLYKTTDGGVNWERKDTLIKKELNCIKFFDEMNGVIVGGEKKILYTSDRGETWNLPAAIIDSTGKTPSLNSVAYANKDLLYAVGASAIYRSSNGGANWDYVDLPEKTTWNSIKFQDSSTGYMVGGSYIMKTTDSGYSWTNISDSTISGTLYDIDIDEKGFVWVCGTNSSIYTNKVTTSDVAKHEIPSEFTLSHNYPNPFNPSTTIIYTVPKEGIVELRVYDVLGQEVRTLINEFQQAGTHRTTFNAGQLSSGTYFYTIKYNNFLQSRKMTLIK